MKASLRWLNTMTDIPGDIRQFSEHLELTGTAVDAIETIGTNLNGVVIGQIVTSSRLPDSDHLQITTVDVGTQNTTSDGLPTPLQIVCGAANFKIGDKVAVALVGTTLPDGTQIRQSKIRGVTSYGMNCSARELGLGDDHDGILILPADAPIGTAFSDYMGLSDTVFDFDITPNRADCMSMIGLAREIATINESNWYLPDISELTDNSEFAVARDIAGNEAAGATDEQSVQAAFPGAVEDLVGVSVDDASRSARYTARLICGVKVGPSPDWLIERIRAAGARPINNIVDITNYIMFEVGQPLHAFDFDTLTRDENGKVQIAVRAAKPDECFTTLDGIERSLSSDVTCIVDACANGGAGQTIALAGVMGGLTSEVTDSTVNILLESATFSPAHTSRTSRRLKLVSESSMRYERGVDDHTCDEYSARAAMLIAAIAGGQIATGIADCYPTPRPLPVLKFRVLRFWNFVGAEIPLNDIESILSRLGCSVQKGLEDGMTLTVVAPGFRPDLLREVDLYEEVLRVWGMNRVTPTLPGGRERIGLLSSEQTRLRQISLLLRAMGLNETMTYAFVPTGDSDDVPMLFSDEEQAVELINPMSLEMAVLRRSILPALLRSVAYNLNHGTTDIQLFEIGNVFSAAEGRKLPVERQMLAAVMVGSKEARTWNRAAETVDFFDAKGILETIGRELSINKLRFTSLETSLAPWLQSGRAAMVLAGSTNLGWIGEVNPRVSARFGIEVPVIAFELDYSLLIGASSPNRDVKIPGLYPEVNRDLAVVVDVSVSAEQITQVIQSAGGTLLDSVFLFDVFEDSARLAPDKKSLAFALSYRASDRTLTTQEVEVLHQKVIEKVKNVLGGEIRS